MKILSSNKLVKGTTLTSRTFQETLMATAGSSPYQSIATFLENNPLQIDQFAKFIGNNAAYFTINTYREAHYHSKDNRAITILFIEIYIKILWILQIIISKKQCSEFQPLQPQNLQ